MARLTLGPQTGLRLWGHGRPVGGPELVRRHREAPWRLRAWTPTDDGRQWVVPLADVEPLGEGQVTTLTLDEGERVELAPTTPVLTVRGWQPAHEVTRGAELPGWDDVPVRVTAVQVAPVPLRLAVRTVRPAPLWAERMLVLARPEDDS